MPVDFIKARLQGVNIPKLTSNKLFKQTRETYIDSDFGECSKLILEYKNLVITIYKNKVAILTGSLHYFYNDGIHNYNNFTFTNLVNTLEEVAKLLEIELHQIILQNITSLCSPFVPCIPLRYHTIVAELWRWENKNSWSDVHGLFS